MNFFAQNLKLSRVLAAQPAGGNDTLTGDIVDMAGWDGVIFALQLGAVGNAAIPTLRAQSGALGNGADMSNLVGAATVAAGDSNGNGTIVVDLWQPLKRYIRPQLDRGGVGNITVDSVLAIQYSGREEPITQSPTLLGSALIGNPL